MGARAALGGRIYFSGSTEGIEAVSEEGGGHETLTLPDADLGEKTRRFPHALPGGAGILFTLGSIGISSYAGRRRPAGSADRRAQSAVRGRRGSRLRLHGAHPLRARRHAGGGPLRPGVAAGHRGALHGRPRREEADPVLSPDGLWLACTSDETGQSELYVQRFPQTGGKTQISVGAGEAPLWAPDGSELYYWKGSRLMAVPVTTRPGFVPGEVRPLPQPRFSVLLGWDIAPDGSRFVVVGRAEAGPNQRHLPLAVTDREWRVAASVPEIRVVVDWFEELRRGPS